MVRGPQIVVSLAIAALAGPAAALELGRPVTLGEAGVGGPAVAAADELVLVAWSGTGAHDGEIVLRRSLDGGASFEAPVAVSGTATPSIAPALAVDGDRVHVAWIEQEDDGNHLLLRSSDDGGATFDAPVPLAGPDLAGVAVRLAASEGRVHAAWDRSIEDEIGVVLVRTSLDGGASFEPARQLNEGGYGTPAIAAEGEVVWVAWDDWGTNDASDVFAAASRDGGRTFGAPVALTDAADENARNVAVALAGGRPTVVWDACALGGRRTCEIRLRRGDGADFGPEERHAPGGTRPAAAATGRFLGVLAIGADGFPGLSLRASNTAGDRFACPLVLGPADGFPAPDLVADEDRLAAAWLAGTAVRFVRGRQLVRGAGLGRCAIHPRLAPALRAPAPRGAARPSTSSRCAAACRAGRESWRSD